MEILERVLAYLEANDNYEGSLEGELAEELQKLILTLYDQEVFEDKE